MQLTAFVITLRRSLERAGQVTKLLDQCPVPCSVWDAVDGSMLSPAEQSAVYQHRLHSPAYPFILRPGEIGCFLSHRGLWRTMVERSITQALVLEDDVELLPNFAESLNFAAGHAGPCDYIQFQVRDLHPRGEVVAGRDELQIIRPSLIPLRTSAQLVTLGAAEKLLRHTEAFDRPVDCFMQMSWLHGVRVLTARPRSVQEISGSLGGSTISNKRRRQRPLDRVSRQWRRTVYRFRIAAQSNQATRRSASPTSALRTRKEADS